MQESEENINFNNVSTWQSLWLLFPKFAWKLVVEKYCQIKWLHYYESALIVQNMIIRTKFFLKLELAFVNVKFFSVEYQPHKMTKQIYE